MGENKANEGVHWRKEFDCDFLAGDELEGEVTVTIDRYENSEVFNPKTCKKEPVFAIYFKGAKKGVILNKLNSKAISKVVGSPYTKNWIGKKIILYPKTGRFFGEEQTVIRVKIQKVQ